MKSCTAPANTAPMTSQRKPGKNPNCIDATDGNLGTHLATLESASFIAVEKDFVGRKPRTRVSVTRAGRRAFEQHVEYLRDIIAGAGSDAGTTPS